MFSLRLILLLIASTILSACDPASDSTSKDVIDTEALLHTDSTMKQRTALVGSWYRKQPTTDGSTDEEFIVLNLDGNYLYKSRRTAPTGESSFIVESGLWGVSGGYHYTHALAQGSSVEALRKVDSSDHLNYWVYKVLKLSASKFRYQTVATGNSFELSRVEDNFELP